MSDSDFSSTSLAGSKPARPKSNNKRKIGPVAVENTRRKGKRKHEEDEESDKAYDSDNLDDESAVEVLKARQTRTRQAKKRRVNNSELQLEEGQEVVGVVVEAPKTGLVPPGQISRNTFNFLGKLNKTECNNRAWFKLNESVYRAAEKEWKAFVEAFTDLLIEVDPHIPHLPPKDVIHRIYRDVRFSNDKTPYKRNLSASFSRSGRKGIFAGFPVRNLELLVLSHLTIMHDFLVRPGNESLIAAGSWCPNRNELATIRSNIQRNSQRLRDVISSPEFVKFFGEAKPHPKGERQNIFGGDDELKTAPKGVPKDHRDIDLLKCRSFAVMYHFPDSEALSPDFNTKLADVARVLRPFVHCLNDMMTIQDMDDEDEDQTGEED